jgi:thiamine biosynthesis lipoprotein
MSGQSPDLERANRLRRTRQLAALSELGLERIDRLPLSTEVESIRLDQNTYQFSQVRPAMATLVSVTVLHPSESKAAEAVGRAYEEMDRVIGLLNRFDPASAVTELNRDWQLRDSPPELMDVFQHALHYHRLSRGAFDVTVKPLVDLYRQRVSSGAFSAPGAGELAEALELVGSEKIGLAGCKVSFERSGMGVTLDGIAKGFVVDRISETLRRWDMSRYLINAGGDIRAGGGKTDHLPWKVAVQDPSKQGDFPDIIHLSDGAVATSGSYESYFDDERRFHHIVSSETGRSPEWSRSVSVMAPTAMAADALATALSVMRPAEGMEFVASLRGCESLSIDGDGKQRRTEGWRSAVSPDS